MKRSAAIVLSVFLIVSSASFFLLSELLIKEVMEKEKVRSVLNKVASQEIAEELLTTGVDLGGEERVVTILFADIRNFTQMIQKMSPCEVGDLVNMYMMAFAPMIASKRGVIDKYIGDSVMVLFGVPKRDSEGALLAVECALEMVELIKAFNAKRKESGLFPVEFGLGIHTGEVLVGNIGAQNRLNYTVIGKNVNLASRLCASAQGMQIRISAETWNQPDVQNLIQAQSLGLIPLKGFDEPIEVFLVIGQKS